MKLRTKNGEWILTDGTRVISFESGTAAFAYMLIMTRVRPVPCTTPTIYPVRSLIPHPKKRRLTKKQYALVRKIKAEMPACYI